jgi:hypothetical protein
MNGHNLTARRPLRPGMPVMHNMRSMSMSMPLRAPAGNKSRDKAR